MGGGTAVASCRIARRTDIVPVPVAAIAGMAQRRSSIATAGRAQYSMCRDRFGYPHWPTILLLKLQPVSSRDALGET